MYQRFDVVRDGRVVWMEDAVASGAISWSTVLSLPAALDSIVPQLAAAPV